MCFIAWNVCPYQHCSTDRCNRSFTRHRKLQHRDTWLSFTSHVFHVFSYKYLSTVTTTCSTEWQCRLLFNEFSSIFIQMNHRRILSYRTQYYVEAVPFDWLIYHSFATGISMGWKFYSKRFSSFIFWINDITLEFFLPYTQHYKWSASEFQLIWCTVCRIQIFIFK